jgi:nucleolar protein 56
MHYLVVNPLGLFVFDEKNKLVKFKYLGSNPEEVALKIDKAEKGVDFQELSELKAEFSDLFTKQPNQATDFLRSNFRSVASETKAFGNEIDMNKFMGAVMVAKSRLSISKIERRDKLIIQSVSALSDMEKIINTIIERLREWYGLHYPELDVKDHEKYASLIAQYGDRKNFPDFKGRSMGMELKEEDSIMLQSYARQFRDMSILKKNLEKYIETVVQEEIPNLNGLLGSNLAAKLLALAGSLEKMAKMPSSSIQLLGAEKSLFKFLKDKGRDRFENIRPPRFGILYLHPDITTARRDLQGKIARVLSSKLTLAARSDFYTKKDISKELLADYRKKVDEILKTPEPTQEQVDQRNQRIAQSNQQQPQSQQRAQPKPQWQQRSQQNQRPQQGQQRSQQKRSFSRRR